MFHNIAADEEFDDSKETALENHEDVDGDEDGPDSLHPMCHHCSCYGQDEHQQTHNLEYVDAVNVSCNYWKVFIYQCRNNFDFLHISLVDDEHRVWRLVGDCYHGGESWTLERNKTVKYWDYLTWLTDTGQT